MRAGCSKVEPKIFTPSQTPFPGAQDGQNLISWRWSLPLPTNPVWWRSMHAMSSYRGNRPTNKHTHTQTHRQDRLQYTPPQLASVECKNKVNTCLFNCMQNFYRYDKICHLTSANSSSKHTNTDYHMPNYVAFKFFPSSSCWFTSHSAFNNIPRKRPLYIKHNQSIGMNNV